MCFGWSMGRPRAGLSASGSIQQKTVTIATVNNPAMIELKKVSPKISVNHVHEDGADRRGEGHDRGRET